MRIYVEDTLFCLVDVQDKLYPHVTNKDEIEKNLVTLVKGLKVLSVPFIVNEQYKKGIGETIPSIKELVEEYPHFEKQLFLVVKMNQQWKL